jgi:putative iron-regulated protein
MKIKSIFYNAMAFAILSTSFISCTPDKEDDIVTPVIPVDNTAKQAVVDNYATIVHASYEDALIEAENLRTEIVSFLNTPSQAGFDACKQAYLNTREPYGQTEAYRLYAGPIDDENGKEGLMNGWPMNELFIDYVASEPTAGIINNPTDYPLIDISTIESLNELGGETNIATGFHAIEFLLWGQDQPQPSLEAGNRPYTDYVIDGTGTNLNQQRRGQYLLAATDLLIENLTYTKDAWNPGEDNYRKQFETQDPNISLQLLITGLGKITKGEVFGERMTVALETQDQEDEHSCFSDQTHKDFQLNITGIHNVYMGNYTRIDGTVIDGYGLDELVAASNSAINTATINAINSTTDAVFLIQAPFDVEITIPEGQARIQDAITKGFALADQIVAGAEAIGVPIVL